jgi:putative transposase
MGNQKQAVLELVEAHRGEGRSVSEILGSVGVARSSYYRWKAGAGERKEKCRWSYELTGEERQMIAAVKESHPEYRHRRIQGVLQQQGVYLSASAIYRHLKELGQVEPYERRAAPWDSALYEAWQRNLLWGSDWTKLLVGGVRWYLLTVIDFFSRLLIAYEVVPTVHAGHVKAVYQEGLKSQGMVHSDTKPQLRVDRGSPNTSDITQEFFTSLGAKLSFARVRRPTDNALTERFYATVKQEEIYLVGNYPDEQSAREELGRYIEFYNQRRPHQALYNFTPAHVHQLNSKTALIEELNEMKTKTREKRKAYWTEQQKISQASIAGGTRGKGQTEIVDPGANTEAVFQPQQPDSHNESPKTKNDSPHSPILSH